MRSKWCTVLAAMCVCSDLSFADPWGGPWVPKSTKEDSPQVSLGSSGWDNRWYLIIIGCIPFRRAIDFSKSSPMRQPHLPLFVRVREPITLLWAKGASDARFGAGNWSPSVPFGLTNTAAPILFLFLPNRSLSRVCLGLQLHQAHQALNRIMRAFLFAPAFASNASHWRKGLSGCIAFLYRACPRVGVLAVKTILSRIPDSNSYWTKGFSLSTRWLCFPVLFLCNMQQVAC